MLEEQVKQAEPNAAMTLEEMLAEIYWRDINDMANDTLEAMRTLADVRHVHQIDWAAHKANFHDTVNQVVAADKSWLLISWRRILTASNHADDGLQGDLSEFNSSLELIRYLCAEAIIGDVEDRVIDLREQAIWERDKIRANELREAGWTDSEVHGDVWLTDKGVFVGSLDEAYQAWELGYLYTDCSNCGGSGGGGELLTRCPVCYGNGEVKVDV